MKKRVLPSSFSGTRRSVAPPPETPPVRSSVLTTEIIPLAENWFVDHEIDQRSQRTIENRRGIITRFHWFLTTYGIERVGTSEIKQFLLYLQRGHMDPGGRFDVADSGSASTRATAVKPIKKATADTYYRNLHAFFEYLIAEDHLDESPFTRRIRKPGKYDRDDQIQPFSNDQVTAMLLALRNRVETGNNFERRQSRRDVAIVHLLLDTGLRAEELCALTFGDINYKERRVTVVKGKGGKLRTIRFGRQTAHAIAAYMRSDSQRPRPNQLLAYRSQPEPKEPFFIALRGKGAGQALKRSGLWQIFKEIERYASITGVRCSPHTCRHTFAVNFLRAGGQPFALMEIMGHTDLTQTQKYVRFVQADIDRQGAMYSPMDNRPTFGYAALGTSVKRAKKGRVVGEVAEKVERKLPSLPEDEPESLRMALLSRICDDEDLIRIAEAVRSVLNK
jgi:site-specific recombinase XerD